MAKTVNFTAEEMKLLAAYDKGAEQAERDAQVASIAEQTGREKRSIIAKLSNMGVYKAKERVTKSGEAVISKADLVATIAAMVSTTGLDTLVKATKSDLSKLVAALNVSRETSSD